MRTFFWEFDDYNDINRQWLCFILNILSFLFTIFAVIRTIQYHKTFVFQIIPLSLNLLATLILLLLKLFEKGYQFDFIGYLIQIFTYFLFCYTFSIILLRIKKDKINPQSNEDNQFKYSIKSQEQIQNQENNSKRRLCNILLFIMILVLISTIILVPTQVISRSCDQNLQVISVACLISQFISYFPTLYIGYLIFQILNTKKNKNKKINKNQSTIISQSYQNKYQSILEETQIQKIISADNDLLNSFKGLNAPLKDQYSTQRKNQIRLVLITYTLSLIIRSIILLVSILVTGTYTFLIIKFIDPNFVQCQQFQGVFIITSEYLIGQIYLIIIELNQLLPHIIIPIAMYIIPVGRKRANKSIRITQKGQKNEQIGFKPHLDQDQDVFDYDNRDQVIKSRVSSIISDRLSLSPLLKQNSHLSSDSTDSYRKFY